MLDSIDLSYAALAFIALCFVIAAGWHYTMTLTYPGEPPFVPTLIPYIGHAIEFGTDAESFLKRCVGEFGSVFTLLVAGERMTIIGDALDYGNVFRQSRLSFEPIADSVSSQAFGVSYLKVGLDQHWVNKNYRAHLQGAGLKPLTSSFLREIPSALNAAMQHAISQQDTVGTHHPGVVPLYELVLQSVFYASATALFGPSAATRELCNAFTKFDDSFALLVGGAPAWALRGVVAARDTIRSQFNQVDIDQHPMMHERNAKLEQTALEDRSRGGDGGGAGEKARVAMQSEILWAAEANTIPAVFWAIAFLLNDERENGAMRAIEHEGMETLGRALLRNNKTAAETVTARKDDMRTDQVRATDQPASQAIQDEGNHPDASARMAQKAHLLSALTPADLDGMPLLDSLITETLRMTTASLTVRLAMKNCTLQVGQMRHDAVKAALKARGLGIEDVHEGQLPVVRTINIRKGDRVAVFPPLLHKDPAVFPDPEIFRFDRHVDPGVLENTLMKARMAAHGPGCDSRDVDVDGGLQARRPVQERKHWIRIPLVKAHVHGSAGNASSVSAPDHVEREVLHVPMPRVGGESVVMPFGGGKSKCPGRMFARNEIRLMVLAFVLLMKARLEHKDARRSSTSSGDPGVSPAMAVDASSWPDLLKSRAGLGILPPLDRTALNVRLEFRDSGELEQRAIEAANLALIC